MPRLRTEKWGSILKDGHSTRGRVAKLLMTELPQRNVANLPDEMVTHLEKLFQSINNAMPRLKDGPIAGKAT